MRMASRVDEEFAEEGLARVYGVAGMWVRPTWSEALEEQDEAMRRGDMEDERIREETREKIARGYFGEL